MTSMTRVFKFKKNRIFLFYFWFHLKSNIWFYGFNATSFHIFYFFVFVFVNLVPFGILLHYPNIGSSQCFREGAQRIIDNDFREML